MTRVTYIGSHDAVDLPEIGIEGLTRGDSLDVDDAFAERLLEQPDNWTHGEADLDLPASSPATADLDEE